MLKYFVHLKKMLQYLFAFTVRSNTGVTEEHAARHGHCASFPLIHFRIHFSMGCNLGENQHFSAKPQKRSV